MTPIWHDRVSFNTFWRGWTAGGTELWTPTSWLRASGLWWWLNHRLERAGTGR